MPDSRDSSDGISTGERLDALHAQVVANDDADERLSGALSNKRKVTYVCSVLGTSSETFDLCDEYPLAAWVQSEHFAYLRCGLYICMMRHELFDLVAGDMAPKDMPGELWQMQAEAEYMTLAFNKKMILARTGAHAEDPRVFH